MRFSRFTLIILSLFSIGFGSAALAVPYASSVRDVGGGTWEFVLNEAADAVTVLRDGGNALNLGAIGAGRYQFEMGSFTSFSIEVSKNAPTAWTSITDPSNPFDDFTFPTGVIINQNPTDLAYFGTVYVGNADSSTTKSGRTMGDGIYALTADMKGVDLAGGFAEVLDANDVSQAKHPGFDVVAGGTTAPNRLNLDASGNVIIGDWSDQSGGVKYASRDLATGGRILGGVDADGNPVPDGSDTGPDGGVFSQETDEFGRIPLHGSVVAKPYVTGTVGVDLTLWTMDEDLDADLAVPQNDTNNVWRYNVGSATDYDAMAPELVISSTDIPAVSDGGTNFIGAFGAGVRAGMHYDPTFNKWYLNQPRDTGTTANGSSVVIVEANPDGSDALAPEVVWSSREFSIENNLDADPAVATVNDVFRRVGHVTITPDKKFLVMHRVSASDAQNGVGTGAVLLVPLDENGVPALTVEGGMITNVIDVTTLGNNGAHNSGVQVEFDAAGNMYVANSAVSTTSSDPLLTGQLVQVFSPGGNWKATTSSNGTFTLSPLAPGGILGDYNNNGTVDAADYVLWRKGGPLPNQGDNPSVVDEGDYNFWRMRFGETSNSGSALVAAVPEPATWTLSMMAFCLFARRRRW